MKGGRWILVLVTVIAVSIFFAARLGKCNSEDGLAWKEFTLLVHPNEGKPGTAKKPEWISWATKCDVGFSVACDNIAPKNPSVPADRTAAEIPFQTLANFNNMPSQEKQEQFVLNYAAVPELASVLYNPIAEESIRRNKLYDAATLDGIIRHLDSANVSGAKRRFPPDGFAPGSEIVKLIWEIIPDTDGKELRLYDLVEPSVLDENTLEPIIDWSARYQIDRDTTKPCQDLKPYGSKGHPQTVPIKCFYFFSIDEDNPCSTLSKEVRFVWGCESGPMKGHRFLVFLVGFHVMKLTATNPDWVWSTYFWTRDTNEADTGSRWEAPWNHYHQETTTAIREDAGTHAFCFNPYLEGTAENGRKANCLSCHSFAAYAHNIDKLKSGTDFGKQYPFPKEKRLQEEQNYFVGAVQTSFVWSISTSLSKPTGSGYDATSFQNILKSAILEQFQSQ